MPTSLRSCNSRCRLEAGTPIRRANSETYQAFSGCTSVAARIPWRVFGNSASRVRSFRILRYYIRFLRNCKNQLLVLAAGYQMRSSLGTLCMLLKKKWRRERDSKSVGMLSGRNLLKRYIPEYSRILFGPVFPSLTKPGYGPSAGFPWLELRSVLREGRTPSDARV